MEAKKVILVATGSAKTQILADAVLKPANESVPA
jgi:6-phosphogluconolactonase/glucosamine-6-phosphate isomerase/deaminase